MKRSSHTLQSQQDGSQLNFWGLSSREFMEKEIPCDEKLWKKPHKLPRANEQRTETERGKITKTLHFLTIWENEFSDYFVPARSCFELSVTKVSFARSRGGCDANSELWN